MGATGRSETGTSSAASNAAASSAASSAATGGAATALGSGGAAGTAVAGANAIMMSRDAGASTTPGPDLGDDAGSRGPTAPVAADAGPIAECAMDFAACVEDGPLEVDECLDLFSGCKAFASGPRRLA